MRGRITIFSLPNCARCDVAKDVLGELGADVRVIEVTPATKPLILRLIGQEGAARLQAPQVFFNLHHVGGAKEMAHADKLRLLADRHLAATLEDDMMFASEEVCSLFRRT